MALAVGAVMTAMQRSISAFALLSALAATEAACGSTATNDVSGTETPAPATSDGPTT